ncbi:MAG: Spy/CpxP family protein refolding chaperone [Dokdonella sp.]
MTISNKSTPLPRRYFKRAAALALLAGLAITAGVTAIAQSAGAAGWHHPAAMSATNVDTHVDDMLRHIFAEIDVTDAQKAQIEPLVKQAVADCRPLHEQFHAAHADVLALLGADTVDRAAIENLRADNLRLADQASKRITQLLADIAEVMTPAQRKALVARIAAHHADMEG